MNAKTVASALFIVATTGYPSNWVDAAEDSLVTTLRISTVKSASSGASISATQIGNTTSHAHIMIGSSSYGYHRALEKLRF